LTVPWIGKPLIAEKKRPLEKQPPKCTFLV